MSREQELDQQPGQDAAAPATETADSTYGLRPDLHAQIMRMSPADAGKLAEMIQTYPSLNGAILAVAASHMGNAAVQRAIALVKRWTAQVAPGVLGRDEVRDNLREPADSLPTKSNEMVETLHDASDGPLPTEEPATPKPAAPEPGWVAGARAFNAAHAGLVAEFNELTDDVCVDDDGDKLDPKAVARWQAHHGLDADGKVGPHTVAKARAVKAAKAPEVAAAPQADARPPV